MSSNSATPTAKSKASTPKKSPSANHLSPAKSPSNRLPPSRASTGAKTDKAESPSINYGTTTKDFSKFGGSDDGLEGNLLTEFNGSELSIIQLLGRETPKEFLLLEEAGDKKLKEENISLKKDLAMKNSLVERLMKENSHMRTEVNEILGTMEQAKDVINAKLRECNIRVQELEDQILALQDENKRYKEQLQKQNNEANKAASFNELEKHVKKYYVDATQRIDDFYSHLNSQMLQFVEMSKAQYDNFNRTVDNKVDDIKKGKLVMAPEKKTNTNSAQTPAPVKSRPTTAVPSRKSSMAQLKKSTTLTFDTEPNEQPSPTNTNTSSSRRRRVITMTDFNDLAGPLLSGIVVNTDTSRQWKSPKATYTPSNKKMTFKV